MSATIDQVRAAIRDLEKGIADLDAHVPHAQLVAISGMPFFRHEQYDSLLACYVKCVRAVSSLNACLVLLDAGYTYEVHALCRSIDECSQDVTFLVTPGGENGEPTDKQLQMLEDFFQEEWTDPSSPLTSGQPRTSVPRRKVHAHISRAFAGDLGIEDTQALHDTIYRAFSGYVHSAYVMIMELYRGRRGGFHLRGTLDTPRMDEALQSLASVSYRALCAGESVAGHCGAGNTYASLRTARQKYFAEAKLGVDKGSPAEAGPG